MPRPKPTPAKASPKPRVQRAPNAGIPFQPTEEQRTLVRLCMAIGYTQEQAARLIGPHGITVETLVKYFRPEIERGAEQVLAGVAANLMSIARDRSHPKSVTAAIFVLKARAGWRDRDGVTVDVDGVEGAAAAGPVEFTIKIGEATPKD